MQSLSTYPVHKDVESKKRWRRWQLQEFIPFHNQDITRGVNILIQTFECPICGNDMEKGYLLSMSGIYWNTHVTKGITKWKCRGESFGKDSDFSNWRNYDCAKLAAQRCRRCNLIIYK